MTGAVTPEDEAHMAHALRLAARGLGQVWPNPAVGCVIVQGARVVGRGWTQPGGRPHAETCALDRAGPSARGATAFVTLEPCAHHGQTPPCAEALIGAGISRVVTARTDPDPRVSGRGHAMLRAAGIAVTEGVMADAARILNAGFFKRVTKSLPRVTLKLATSLDGRIATASGESRWITGPQARRMVHVMRSRHDAVMIGSGTAIADDPDLTVRDLGVVRQPVRIVLDSRLRLSPDSRLGCTARAAPVWLCHGAGVSDDALSGWGRTGAHLIACPMANGALDLTATLTLLADRGLTRIFCEGGAELAAALVRAGLVDEIAVFTAGKLIGGDGLASFAPLGLSRLADAPGVRLMGQSAVGADSLTHWTFD